LKNISVVITTYNRRKKVLATIQSVLASENLQNILELMVIDDASTDGTSESLKSSFSSELLKVIRCKQEQLVSKCRNIGLREARGQFILFLDDDVIVSPKAISQLCTFLSQNVNVACVMPMILHYNRPDLIWCAGIRHNFWTTHGVFFGYNEVDNGQFKSPINSDSVITMFMVRKSIATKIWFDSKTFPIGWEDMDFAMKMKKAGYSVYVLPWVKAWHDFPNARFVKNKLRLYFEVRNRIIFHKRWSTNILQYFCSVTFSLATGLIYLFLSIFYLRKFIMPVKTVFTALGDGLLSRYHNPSDI